MFKQSASRVKSSYETERRSVSQIFFFVLSELDISTAAGVRRCKNGQSRRHSSTSFLRIPHISASITVFTAEPHLIMPVLTAMEAACLQERDGRSETQTKIKLWKTSVEAPHLNVTLTFGIKHTPGDADTLFTCRCSISSSAACLLIVCAKDYCRFIIQGSCSNTSSDLLLKDQIYTFIKVFVCVIHHYSNVALCAMCHCALRWNMSVC